MSNFVFVVAASAWGIGIASHARAGGGLPVPPLVLEQQARRVAAIAAAVPAAVCVFSHEGNDGGSAVMISSDGYAISNYHVVRPIGPHLRCGMSDGHVYDAVVVGLDPTGDVALIRVLGRDDFPTATLGDSDTLRAGQECFAVGNPFLLATDLQPTVTYGMISGVHRYQYPAGTLLEYADCIQTDAAINPGNSGGPLFGATGDLIGIVGRGSFEKRGRVNVGVGYAISINQVKNFLGYLQSGRIVDHATLGATVTTADDGRVLVSDILRTSDAHRRGLRIDDEIVSLAGRTVTSVNGLKNMLGTLPEGWRVPLSYVRDGERHNIHVRLARVHRPEELLQKVAGGDLAPATPPIIPPGKKPAEGKDQAPPENPGVPAHGLPPAIAPLYQARRGFANYYFNQRHRQRVWEQHIQARGEASWNGAWTIEGTAPQVGNLQFQLSPDHATGQIADRSVELSLNKDLHEQLAPTGSGGLLLTLHLWQRLSTLGPERYGDVYYLGTAPWPGYSRPLDVLVATHDVTELRCYFDPQTGHLVGLEMFCDEGVDPCEIHFSEPSTFENRVLASKWSVRHGDATFAEINVSTVRVAESAKPGGT